MTAEAIFPVTREGGVHVVVAPEEIDITNAAVLRAALLEASSGCRSVVVDMSGTYFCDSAGLNVLVRAHDRATSDGGQLGLVMDGADVRRIFVITGIDRVIPIFPSRADALTGLAAAVPEPPPPGL